jgi:hypothetical protein
MTCKAVVSSPIMIIAIVSELEGHETAIRLSLQPNAATPSEGQDHRPSWILFAQSSAPSALLAAFAALAAFFSALRRFLSALPRC